MSTSNNKFDRQARLLGEQWAMSLTAARKVLRSHIDAAVPSIHDVRDRVIDSADRLMIDPSDVFVGAVPDIGTVDLQDPLIDGVEVRGVEVTGRLLLPRHEHEIGGSSPRNVTLISGRSNSGRTTMLNTFLQQLVWLSSPLDTSITILCRDPAKSDLVRRLGDARDRVEVLDADETDFGDLGIHRIYFVDDIETVLDGRQDRWNWAKRVAAMGRVFATVTTAAPRAIPRALLGGDLGVAVNLMGGTIPETPIPTDPWRAGVRMRGMRRGNVTCLSDLPAGVLPSADDAALRASKTDADKRAIWDAITRLIPCEDVEIARTDGWDRPQIEAALNKIRERPKEVDLRRAVLVKFGPLVPA